MGYRLRPFTMAVRDNSTQQFIDVGLLGSDVDADVEDLRNEVDSISRHALYLGNSYAMGGGSTSDHDGIFAKTKDLFESAYLFGDGGVGFLTYTNHSVTFDTLLTRAINSGQFDDDEITDVIIIGAWGETQAWKANSTGYVNNLKTAATDLVTRVHTLFPNLKRLVYTFAETRAIHNIPNTSEGTSYYSEPYHINLILEKYLPRCGIEYIGWIGWHIFMMPEMVSSDHYHPNDAGYTTLAAAFKSAYCGTMIYPTHSSTINTNQNGITNGTTMVVTVDLTPHEAIVNVKSIVLGAGTTPAQYTYCKFIDFSSSNYMPPYAGRFVVSDPVIGIGSVAVHYNTQGPDQFLYMKLYLREDSGETYIQGLTYGQFTISNILNTLVSNPQIRIKYAA